jgi:hypothetical protein
MNVQGLRSSPWRFLLAFLLAGISAGVLLGLVAVIEGTGDAEVSPILILVWFGGLGTLAGLALGSITSALAWLAALIGHEQ